MGIRQEFKSIEDKGKLEMLHLVEQLRRNETDKDSADFEDWLKRKVDAFLMVKKTMWGDIYGDKLLNRVIEIVPDDKWMRFARLSLRLDDAEIDHFKKEHYDNNEMYHRINA